MIPRATRRTAIAVVIGLGIATATAIAAATAGARDYDPADEVDHSSFDVLLHTYVTPAGVRYEAWVESGEDRQKLADYVATLAAASPSKLTKDQRLAFWINAYNAVTVDHILASYPVDSIKDTGGLFSSPWKKKRIPVEGRELSLDEIENEIIRKEFTEPRIHFALNCAARSCPPLRAGAYDGRSIDAQLEEQTVAFLGDPSHNFLDEKGKLHLSKIFEWYRQDFETKGTLVNWVRPYFPALEGRTDVSVTFEGYDWALNDAS